MNARNRVFLILGLLTAGSLIWYLATTRRTGDLQLIGTVDANEVVVSSRIPGRIQTLTVNEGQDVKAGQVVATIGRNVSGRSHRRQPEMETEWHRRDRSAEPGRNHQRNGQRRSAGEDGAGVARAGAGTV